MASSSLHISCIWSTLPKKEKFAYFPNITTTVNECKCRKSLCMSSHLLLRTWFQTPSLLFWFQNTYCQLRWDCFSSEVNTNRRNVRNVEKIICSELIVLNIFTSACMCPYGESRFDWRLEVLDLSRSHPVWMSKGRFPPLSNCHTYFRVYWILVHIFSLF